MTVSSEVIGGVPGRDVTADRRARPLRAPVSLRDTGLSFEIVTQLVLKTLFFAGELSGEELATRLATTFGVVEGALDLLKAQRHCEVTGGALVGGSSHRFRITAEGRGVARLFLEQNQYVGPLPVPLIQYRAYLDALQDCPMPAVTADAVRRVYADLVLPSAVRDEICTAINGRRSIFIYGPPGNGKTAIARGLGRLLDGAVAIPHSIEVEGAIIRVFDPVNHRRLPVDESPGLDIHDTSDGRWVMCERPVVSTGGELSLSALDLQYQERLGYYAAPLQIAANGGLLILDDFGRQQCHPRDLLNRWMVPLESGIDYLSLRSGLKFEVPFRVVVVFATNLNPGQLADEAFFRRVQYKVCARNPTPEAYLEIFEQCCRDRSLPAAGPLASYLLEHFYPTSGTVPRACHPRDLITHALLVAEHRGAPRELTPELLDAACAGYFIARTPDA